MGQVSVSIGCVTLSFGSEMMHISVDRSRLGRATRRPSLHERGWLAEHLSVPFVPLARGVHAGTLRIHLTYPDRSHKDIAWLRPDDLRPLGQAFEKALEDALHERLVASAHEIDVRWLGERDLKLLFMFDDEVPAWADNYFKQRGRHYRVSPDRMRQSAGDLWIAEPEILDDEDFMQNHPRCIQAVSLSGTTESLFVWRFPWGPDGSLRWYAAPSDSLVPVYDRQFLETMLSCIGPRFWDAILTILIELGVPTDYDSLEHLFDELKLGRLGRFAELHELKLSAA